MHTHYYYDEQVKKSFSCDIKMCIDICLNFDKKKIEFIIVGKDKKDALNYQGYQRKLNSNYGYMPYFECDCSTSNVTFRLFKIDHKTFGKIINDLTWDNLHRDDVLD